MSDPSSDAHSRVIEEIGSDEETAMLTNHYETYRAEADYRRERLTDQFRRANWRRTRKATRTAQPAARPGVVRVRPAA